MHEWMELEKMERTELYELLSKTERALRTFPLGRKLDLMIGLMEQMELVREGSGDLKAIRKLLEESRRYI